MTSDTIVTGDNKTDVSSTDTIKQAPKRLWMTAFVFAFLILLCDGADIGILAFSLTSLKAEWGLTSVQAGALGSYSLLGMGMRFYWWMGMRQIWTCPRHCTGHHRLLDLVSLLRFCSVLY